MNLDELCREAPEKTFLKDNGDKTTYKQACFSCKDEQGEAAQKQCFQALTEKFMEEQPQQEGKEGGD